jgi:hypothetical protein
VGPCTLAPVTAITLCRYHNRSGVALYHHVGIAREYHWVCISLQKHRMIHASTSRRPHDQLCTNSQKTRQVARAFLSSLELDARVMARCTHTTNILQSNTRDSFGAQHASASGSWEAWQPQLCSHGVNEFTLMASNCDSSRDQVTILRILYCRYVHGRRISLARFHGEHGRETCNPLSHTYRASSETVSLRHIAEPQTLDLSNPFFKCLRK